MKLGSHCSGVGAPSAKSLLSPRSWFLCRTDTQAVATKRNLELSCAISSIGCCFLKVDPLDSDIHPSQPNVEVYLVDKSETAAVMYLQTSSMARNADLFKQHDSPRTLLRGKLSL